MRFLLDEHIPRSLANRITDLGHIVEDVRDVGLRGRPDTEIFDHARQSDAIIVTRDRGFAIPRTWPDGFTAGVIFIDLPDTMPAANIVDKVTQLISARLPVSLEGALTIVESRRALS